MSRHVLTHTLLDFGTSLWRSSTLVDELPGLARSGFEPVGKFGIGFYSVFMLSQQVCVTTRRFERRAGDSSDQWQLRFDEGLRGRPMLTRPLSGDQLHHCGTRIVVTLTEEALFGLFSASSSEKRLVFEGGLPKLSLSDAQQPPEPLEKQLEQALPALLAWLCPASDVEIRASINGRSLGAAVLPGDWLAMSDKALNDRLFCEQLPLHPITDEHGVIFGRAGLVRALYHWTQGAIVFQGIRCGALSGLVGVVAAGENNTDARRVGAQIKGSIASWVHWAELVLAAATEVPANDVLIRLHPLLPDKDFPIWSLEHACLTLQELGTILATRSELFVLGGDELSHEDYDEVAQHQFEARFIINSDLLVQPILDRSSHTDVSEDFRINDFPWVLGVKPIDYEQRLREKLEVIWSSFDRECIYDVVVGSVDGVEITRTVTRYSKKDQ